MRWCTAWQSLKPQIHSEIGEIDTCVSIKCNRGSTQTQTWCCGSLHEGSLTFPLVIHTSTPCSVIPVRALNWLCHNHGECSQASHCNEYIWLHYPTTRGVAPRRWCPTGLPRYLISSNSLTPARMDRAICVHQNERHQINSIAIKRHYYVNIECVKRIPSSVGYRWNSHSSGAISDCAKVKHWMW